MLGIYATSIPAEVIDFHAFGDWAYQQLVGCPVGQHLPGSTARPIETAISKFLLRCQPFPATISLLDFDHEATKRIAIAPHIRLLVGSAQ
jgi:hypothetical protein